MQNEILVITHSFPFNTGDSAFIQPEVRILGKIFSKIHIICRNRNCSKEKISLLPNFEVSFFDFNKENFFFSISGKQKCVFIIQILKSLFLKEFIKEWIHILRTHKKLGSFFRSLEFSVMALYFRIYLEKYLSHHPEIRLVYTYWNSFEVLSALFIKKKRPNLRVVSRIHGYDLYEEITDYLYQPYKKYIAKNIDHIFFISKNGYEYFIRKWNDSIYDRKFSVCYLGTNPNESIKPGKTKNIFSILSCSYMVPVKRLDKLIESLALIENLSVRWIHIGNGSLESEIKAYAKEKLSHKENIQFEFLGFMPNGEVRKHLSLNFYDLFINVSVSEGIPVSIMEAMSVRIPVIATNVGGVSEIVNETNGYLLPVDFVEGELAQLIVLYSKKTLSEQERYRENAYKTWETYFNAETNYNKLSSVLLNLIK